LKRTRTDTAVRYLIIWAANTAAAMGTGYAIGDFGVLRAKSATDALLLSAGIGVTAFIVVGLLAAMVLMAAGYCIEWTSRDGVNRPDLPVNFEGQGREKP
jgi:hypothetical protein